MPQNAPLSEYLICWSCTEPLDELRWDYTLDGVHVQVCENCWEQLSVYERLLLQLLARPRKFGGLDLGEALEAFGGIYRAFKEHRRQHQGDEEEPDSDD